MVYLIISIVQVNQSRDIFRHGLHKAAVRIARSFIAYDGKPPWASV
jgi:hypothetical protein